MKQTLQFTLDQVARQMNLSEGVVSRLAQYFQLPAAYFRAPAGQPRLMLFLPDEVDQLRKAQQLLVSGMTLAEIKTLLDEERYAASVDKAGQVFEADEWDEDDDLEDLAEYDQSERMKEQLAHLTFQQYRLKNHAQKPPFKVLAQALASKGEDKTPVNRSLPLEPDTAMETPGLETPETNHNTSEDGAFAGGIASPLSMGSAWMTPELQQRALALQRELLLKSGTNSV